MFKKIFVNRFYNKYGFPGVVGCVDCTHVAIVPPKKNCPTYPEHIYVNRKGYHSINVQIVCILVFGVELFSNYASM